MNLTAKDVYAWCNEDGTYAQIMEQLESLEYQALANVTYGEHFTKATNAGDLSYSYIDCIDGLEFSTLLFGQICHSSIGTRLSAIGNYSTGFSNTPQPIRDHTSIKDVLVLSCPTFTPDCLTTFYNNQVATLCEVRVEDKREELALGKIPTVVKECIRAMPNSPTAPADLIVVTLPKKYAIPATPKNKMEKGNKPAQITKQRVSSESDMETLKSEQEDHKAGEAEGIDSGYKIELGAFYPLEMLPDHRGPYFQQSKAKLVQLDIRDSDNNLLAPWHLYEKLRPGTVILVQASLVVWIINDEVTNAPKKYYHLVGHSIKILAESIEYVEEREIPVLVKKAGSFRGPAAPSPAKPASKAFALFESPSKKNRKM